MRPSEAEWTPKLSSLALLVDEAPEAAVAVAAFLLAALAEARASEQLPAEAAFWVVASPLKSQAVEALLRSL